MTLFIIGLTLFFIPHFYSAVRSRAEGKDKRVSIGEAKYMGTYSVITLIGFVLMIWGYTPIPDGPSLYEGPHELHHYSWVFMLPAFILLAAAYTPLGYIKRSVQHPMMHGTLIWAIFHLALGGDLKRIILFGAFAAYAIISLAGGYKRGTDFKGVKPNFMGDILAIIVGLVITGAFMHGGHQVLFGTSPF
ncbi:MAG: NnrU family protein [Hellea sp.]|nr:NnrU family protein [Hellea sp.]